MLTNPNGLLYSHVLWDRIITDPKDAIFSLKGVRKETYRLFTTPDRIKTPANITMYYDITPIGGMIYRMQGPSLSHPIR